MTNVSSSIAPTEWAAFVAIDWADQKHFWALTPSGSDEVERSELDATPEAVDAWAAELNVRFSGRPIAVCLEQKGGALVYMLAKYAHVVIFPVHPKTAAQYRQTFCPSLGETRHFYFAWTGQFLHLDIRRGGCLESLPVLAKELGNCSRSATLTRIPLVAR